MADLTDFEREAVRLALVKMFRPSGFFDVCVFDQCCKVVGVAPDTRVRAALGAIHCVPWSDMTPETRQLVADEVIRALSVPRLDLSALEPTKSGDVASSRSFLQRLRA